MEWKWRRWDRIFVLKKEIIRKRKRRTKGYEVKYWLLRKLLRSEILGHTGLQKVNSYLPRPSPSLSLLPSLPPARSSLSPSPGKPLLSPICLLFLIYTWGIFISSPLLLLCISFFASRFSYTYPILSVPFYLFFYSSFMRLHPFLSSPCSFFSLHTYCLMSNSPPSKHTIY